MHITGDLSLADFGTLIEPTRGYPKLADYLHTAYPGTKFITVGPEVLRGRVGDAPPTGDIGGAAVEPLVELVCSTTCRTTLGGRYRFPAGKNVPDLPDRRTAAASTSTRTAATTTAPRRRSRRGCTRRTATASSRGPTLRPRRAPRRRHLGRRCGDRDDGQGGLVRHVRHDGRDRQGRAHVGRAGRAANFTGVVHTARPAADGPRRPTSGAPPRTPTSSSASCSTR